MFNLLNKRALGIAGIVLLGASAAVAKPAPAVAERVMEALRAANTARSQNAKEAEQWRAEQARLELVRDTIRQQIAQLRSDARSDRAAVAALNARRATLGPQEKRRADLETFARDQGARINDALDRLALEVPPGTIPKRPEAASDPIDAALHRVEAAEKNASTVSVELATGQLGSDERTVEILRVGGVLAWWRALDGSDAGVALIKDGTIVLRPAASPEQALEIQAACDITKGRKAPRLIGLPVAHARRSGGAQ